MTVTYEQAKRLKELGFNQKVTAYYVDGSLDYNSPINWNTNEGRDENGEYQDEDEYCSAPIAAEALQWIRDNHQLHGLVDCNASGWFWVIYKTNGTFVKDWNYLGDHEDSGCFTTYEKSESAVLDELLTYIKKNE